MKRSGTSYARDLLQKGALASATLIRHPFHSHVRAGTLSENALLTYLAEDGLYLAQFAQRLEELARLSRAGGRRAGAAILKKHAEETLVSLLSQQRFARESLGILRSQRERVPRPTTHAYINHQRSCVSEGPAEGLASLLPCYFLYRDTVANLKTNGSKSALLQSWIESLPDDQANGMWVEEIVRVTDECLAALNRVRHLDEIFWISSSYEFMLLDMCLRDEKWQLLPA